jgi:hypothetical protein
LRHGCGRRVQITLLLVDVHLSGAPVRRTWRPTTNRFQNGPFEQTFPEAQNVRANDRRMRGS